MAKYFQAVAASMVLSLTLTLSLLTSTNGKAQELPNQVLPSPTTMQFQKYGDYPVSYYTGIPDIKVPIYTIKEGDITVPIYLSFHASGLQIDELENPGIIGPGWTLQTGGMMSRVINGRADDFYEGITIPDFSTNYQSNYYLMKDYYNDVYDHQFDVFTYNFLGRSGKFIPWAQSASNFFPWSPANSPSGNEPYDPFVIKEDNLLVSPNGVTDENGITYAFGGEGREEEVNYSMNMPNYYNMAVIGTWHLAAIYSSKHPGMGVGYTYQQGRSTNSLSRMFILDDAYEQGGDHPDPAVDASNQFPYSYPPGNNLVNNALPRSYFTRVIERINFSEGYLRFYLNNSKQLTKIEIYSKDNDLLRTVELVSSNFSAGLYRKLEAVVFKDALGSEQERYSFSYYNENSQMSKSKDYWGFYNGSNYWGHWVPTFTRLDLRYLGSFYKEGGRSITFAGSLGSFTSREPEAGAAKTYMLQKITYPTGGYTIFDYEGNSSVVRQLGGLRIKNISSYDRGGALASSKTYTYSPGNTEVYIENGLFQEDNIVFTDGMPARRRRFSENPSVPLMPKGAPVGYPTVVETEGPTTTTYHFDDQPAYEYDIMNFPVTEVPGQLNNSTFYRMNAHHYKPWNFGDLRMKTTEGPGFYRIETYDYESFTKNTVHDLVMKQHVEFIPSSSIDSESGLHQYVYQSVYNFAKRYHHSGVKRLVRKTYWDGDALMGQGVSTDEIYSYADAAHPMQITSKTSINSKGETIINDMTYPYDHPGAANAMLVELHEIANPIQQIETNVTAGNKEVSRVALEYDFFNPTLEDPGYVFLKNIKKSVGGGSLETEATAERYDTKGHILQQRGKDGIVVSFIFGYKESYPVAKIVGADYASAIALVNPTLLNTGYALTDDAGIRANLSALRTGLPNAQVTTYTYKLGVGITSETDPRGRTIKYEYDNFQRLIAVRDHEGNILKANDYHVQH
jgi:YD repeat-containing protein